MKRKILVTVYLVIALGFVVLFIFTRSSNFTRINGNDLGKSKQLPVELSAVIESENQSSRTYTILNFFGPDCDHCKVMASGIAKNSDKFKNCDVVFISRYGDSINKVFIRKYKLENLSSMYLISDTSYKFFRGFNIRNIPTFFIYKDKILTAKITGETNLKEMLNQIKEFEN